MANNQVNPKHQIPMTKQIPITNDPSTKQVLFGIWDLEFRYCLEFGIWNFGFGYFGSNS
jgi:hypothetical protein